MAKIVVAYDGTPHADDGLALAHTLGELLGAPLALAHVYRADPHNRSPSAIVRGRDEFLRRQSETLLSRAGDSLAAPATRHAIAGTTTASALRRLAEDEGAALIVFGSAHNGPVGRVHPGSAARRLLQSGRCAIAVAPDGFREREFSGPLAVAIAEDDSHGSARRTAEALAAKTGGSAVEQSEGAQLLVVGSRSDAPAGRVMTNAASDQLVQAANAPVIVVAQGSALSAGGAPAKAA
jgi:nucleotide-binding universal stress UspA family protein